MDTEQQKTRSRYDHRQLVQAAAHASIEAGRYIREQLRENVRVWTKNGVGHPAAEVQSVITECDVRAEKIIRQHLHRAAPGSRIVGEECGAVGDGDLCWYVDALDGTYNFARELPLFCTSVGFTIDDVPCGGCVYDPMHAEIFAAVDGHLFVNGRPYRGRTRTGDRPPLALTDIPHGNRPNPGERDLVLELSRYAEVRRIGSSALALAWLAVGRAEVVANTDVYLWDVAAGRCLVEAAGGRFVMTSGRPGADWRCSFAAWTPGGAEVGPRLLDAIVAIQYDT